MTKKKSRVGHDNILFTLVGATKNSLAPPYIKWCVLNMELFVCGEYCNTSLGHTKNRFVSETRAYWYDFLV